MRVRAAALLAAMTVGMVGCMAVAETVQGGRAALPQGVPAPQHGVVSTTTGFLECLTQPGTGAAARLSGRHGQAFAD